MGALYQCACGKAFTSKVLAMAHAAKSSGNHLIKRVR
jgi:hypothetical protein